MSIQGFLVDNQVQQYDYEHLDNIYNSIPPEEYSRSILTSIKKLLGIESDYTQFDSDIILQINSAFSSLNQLGIGPEEGFEIHDATTGWSSFITGPKFNYAKTYVFLKVKLAFDPPTSSTLMASYENQLNELTWRLSVTE